MNSYHQRMPHIAWRPDSQRPHFLHTCSCHLQLILLSILSPTMAVSECAESLPIALFEVIEILMSTERQMHHPILSSLLRISADYVQLSICAFRLATQTGTARPTSYVENIPLNLKSMQLWLVAAYFQCFVSIWLGISRSNSHNGLSTEIKHGTQWFRESDCRDSQCLVVSILK